MISFEYPAALVLCLLPAVAAIMGQLRKGSRGRAIRLPLDIWAGPASEDAPLPWRLAYVASSILFALAWLSLSLAAAGPGHQSDTQATANTGLNIVFAIDASPSMAAKDLEPTRLEAAKSFVRAFVESPDGAIGASIGLVAFGAEAALACPPTTDYATVLQRLETIEPGILGDGTALGQGLASAFRQISAAGSDRSIAVLLSDGEDNVGLIHPEDAARSLGRHGAGLLVIGIGSRGDIPIDYINPKTGQRMSGAYRSGFDDLSMSAIAASGGGEYRTATDLSALGSLSDELESIARDMAGSSSSGNAPSRISSAQGVSTRHAFGGSLFYIAMALAAAGWALRRLVMGGVA